MDGEDSRGGQGFYLGSLAFVEAFLQVQDAVVWVEAKERVVRERVLGSGLGGKGDSFKPGGSGLWVTHNEEVVGARLEVLLDGHYTRESDLKDPKALVFSGADGSPAPSGKGRDEVAALLILLCFLWLGWKGAGGERGKHGHEGI